MPLIEGIGDEVLQFFTLVFLLIVALVAWWSTRISESPLIRTVVILERRGTRQSSEEASPTEQPNVIEENKTTEIPSIEETNTNIEVTPNNPVEVTSDLPTTEQVGIERSAEREDLPQTSENSCDVEHASTEDVGENSTGDSPNLNPQIIRIRLKYLNDEQKLVDGNLEEQLGDFKRRHFSLELSGRKLVRLIFKGQVLLRDSSTLGHYGLFDNCVVHCIVHNPLAQTPSPNANVLGEAQRQGPISAWALSNVLLAGLSLLLGLAWYGRFQYAQLYTATTTVALVGLTGIFTISLLGLYFPDTMQT